MLFLCLFHRWKKVIHVWNDTRVIKWRQKANFLLNFCLKYSISTFWLTLYPQEGEVCPSAHFWSDIFTFSAGPRSERLAQTSQMTSITILVLFLALCITDTVTRLHSLTSERTLYTHWCNTELLTKSMKCIFNSVFASELKSALKSSQRCLILHQQYTIKIHHPALDHSNIHGSEY